MKKLVCFIVLTVFLGCGKEPVKLATSEEKVALINKALSGDENANKELLEIKAQLKKQMDKGQVEAKAELEEWEEIEDLKRAMTKGLKTGIKF